VCVCDLETSRLRRVKLDYSATEEEGKKASIS
jgi:hypothetical protein